MIFLHKYCTVGEESEVLSVKEKRLNIGYLYALAVGLICGFIPIIIQKVLTQDPVPRATALFIKFVVSSIILLPIAAPKFKKVTYPKGFAWKMLICGVLYVATLILLYESYRFVPTGIGSALYYTFPLFTMGISVLFFGFRCNKYNIGAMIMSLVGTVLLSTGTLSSDNSYIGILLAIGSAVAYAFCLLWTEHQRLAAMDTTVVVTLKTCVSAALFFVYVLVTDQLTFSISLETFLGLALSGVGTILASVFLNLAIRHIGSVHTSILSSVELIVCAVAGYFVLDELISLRSGLGIVVIMGATVLVALSKKDKK